MVDLLMITEQGVLLLTDLDGGTTELHNPIVSIILLQAIIAPH